MAHEKMEGPGRRCHGGHGPGSCLQRADLFFNVEDLSNLLKPDANRASN